MTLPVPATLAVVTWNMHAGVGDLDRLVADLAAGRLTTAAPDDIVLLLQEAVADGPSDPRIVAGQRGMSVAFEPMRRGTTLIGNAILSTRPLQDTRVVPLPQLRQPRTALMTTIAVHGVELFVVNAHFENRVSLWRGLLFSDGARRRQAEALIAELPRGPGIAGGDLNTWLGPNEPAWTVLAERFPDTPHEPTGPTFHDRLVLDHLFFDLPAGWRTGRLVLPQAYGSDHHPVIAVISASSS